jgi:hypothetical protein
MQSGYALGAFLLHHIFAVAETASQFLYRNHKNVIYSWDVKRHFRNFCVGFFVTMNVRIHFCPTVIRLSAPSMARGLVTKKMGEKKVKKEEYGIYLIFKL